MALLAVLMSQLYDNHEDIVPPDPVSRKLVGKPTPKMPPIARHQAKAQLTIRFEDRATWVS